jgi:hypothetical protein
MSFVWAQLPVVLAFLTASMPWSAVIMAQHPGLDVSGRVYPRRVHGRLKPPPSSPGWTLVCVGQPCRYAHRERATRTQPGQACCQRPPSGRSPTAIDPDRQYLLQPLSNWVPAPLSRMPPLFYGLGSTGITITRSAWRWPADLLSGSETLRMLKSRLCHCCWGVSPVSPIGGYLSWPTGRGE